MMNLPLEYTFRDIEAASDNECWNITDEDLSEGDRSPQQISESSLQKNMECNSFWKFDKSYKLRNSSKQKVFDEVVNDFKSVAQQSKSCKLCTIHDSKTRSIGTWSLKEEVSILLRTLVNLKKKNINNSDASTPGWANLKIFANAECKGSSDMEITMRQIEKFEVINS